MVPRMDDPVLEKSKQLIQRGFSRLTDLSKARVPVGFFKDSALADAQRISNEFNGQIVGKKGQRLAVVTDYPPELPNLLVIELLDERTARRVGYVTLLLLHPTRELSVGNFYLGKQRGQGFGRILVESFRGFIPAGVKVKFRIEEYHSKGFLLNLTNMLMKAGEIVNWRLNSPLRPEPSEGKFALLPMKDQLKIEERFLASYSLQKCPVFMLFQAFYCRFSALRTCLDHRGKFIYEAFGTRQSALAL